MAFVGIGCATIAGLDEDFQHSPECNPIVTPAAPKVSNAGDTIEFSAAMRTVDLDEEDDSPRFGFDLDGKCSCSIDGQSCTLPAFVDAKKATCDDARGLDNGAGVALARINALAQGALSSLIINEGATQGLWTLIVRVRNYSGTPNDDHVTVSIYETPGLSAPLWNGTDVWPIANTSVGSSGTVDEPLDVDDKAYVRDGVLVAHVPKARLWFRAMAVSLPIDLVSVTISAKIADTAAGNWRLAEGTMAGKWLLPAVFQSLSAFRYDTNLERRLCRDDIVYLQVKNLFCSATDIIDEATADGSNECNAISFGMRFDTESIQLGAVTNPLPPPVPECSAGFDPATDACAKPK